MKKNALNWFEIYASDLDRAVSFYNNILDTTLDIMTGDGPPMACFPCDMENGVGGCVTKMEECPPGAGGTLVYLNVEGELDAVLSRVPGAGGKIIRDKFAIPPHGFIAIIEDTEGNVVGLHSMQ